MSQPIDLSSLLNLPGRGRGWGTSRGRGTTQGRGTSHGRRAAPQSDVPPSFSPEEVAAGHHDKCQRPDPFAPNTENTQLQDFPVFALTWAPQLVRGNRPVSIGDSADSEETALALSQALLLPVDMKKEIESPPSKLLGSFMVNNIKVTFVVSFLYPALLIAPIAILPTLHNFKPCKRWWPFPRNWTMRSPSVQG